ncbi:hypothetical protein Purlil1_12850 [Purpureocillium lilacinum]|uniref:Uncharacterized protein n=1 Tax=Purpureocillium lilacinum TaxID=33203 RepID=A0ABR0BFQ7_PURLI|nr:hypothetical protein Purlil1_12850 [Purpureocillium lilacinum]
MGTYTDAEGPCVEFTKALPDILVVAGNAYHVIGPEGDCIPRMSDELYFGPVSFIPARSVRDANYRSLPRRTADVWPAPPSGRLSPLRQPHDKRYISTPDGSSVRLIRHSLIDLDGKTHRLMMQIQLMVMSLKKESSRRKVPQPQRYHLRRGTFTSRQKEVRLRPPTRRSEFGRSDSDNARLSITDFECVAEADRIQVT